jgi:hypothetical protein
MPERDDLDRLVDSELAQYAEPRTGLEQRILARVMAEASTQSWMFRGWQWALAVAAAIAVVLLISLPRIAHRGATVNTAGAVSPHNEPITGLNRESTVPATQAQNPHVRPAKRLTKTAMESAEGHKRSEVLQHPKLDVFPAPLPLSAQELSLLQLATRLPKAERERLFSDRDRQDAPLEISSIKISPITVPDLGRN